MTERPRGPHGPDRPARALDRRQALGGLAAAGVGGPLLAACGGGGNGDASGSGGGPDGPVELGATSEVPIGSGRIYDEQEVVVTQPSEGDFRAFTATCTHQGCAVSDVTETIDCVCHGSKFSIEDGSVVQGPASEPLGEVDITVDGGSITVS